MKNSEFKDFDEVATTVSFILIIGQIVYSNDNYDIWDLSICSLVLYIIFEYKNKLIKNRINLILARIGFSISIAEILLSLKSLLQIQFCFMELKSTFVDYDFILSCLIFPLSIFVVKKQ